MYITASSFIANVAVRANRIPRYSRLHPVIPRLYTQPWMHDMKSRTLHLEVRFKPGTLSPHV